MDFLNYIAGFFDGEGSLGVYNRNADRTGTKRYFVLVVSISQGGDAGFNLLQRIQGLFGGSISKKNSVNKQMWQLHLASNKALNFLETLSPLLHLKKEQAELCIQFQKLVDKRVGNKEAEQIAARLKLLKLL